MDGTSAYENDNYDTPQSNTQYQIIMATDDTLIDTRKPVKVKANAKGKPKAKYVGRVMQDDAASLWFARADYQVRRLQLPPGGPR